MPNYNTDKLALLDKTYRVKLAAAAEAEPDQYPWYGSGRLTVDQVADRMMFAVRDYGIGAVSITGHAWEATRKEFGLIHKSYKAWEQWLTEPPSESTSA